jgi:hypothetical protein
MEKAYCLHSLGNCLEAWTIYWRESVLQFCVGGVQFAVYCFLYEPIIAPWFSGQNVGVGKHDPGVIIVFHHDGLLRFLQSDMVVVFYLVLDVAKRSSSPVCTLPRLITCKCLKI